MPEAFAGNFKRHAAPGESHIKGFSDVGSIPTGSTNKVNTPVFTGVFLLCTRILHDFV